MLVWFWHALRQYAVFSGRARRREYWFFTLASLLLSVAIICAGAIVDGVLQAGPTSGIAVFINRLIALTTLALMIPSFAVSVRRLHDTGRSGWWLLLGCVPVIGSIVLTIWFATDSRTGRNSYGPNPKHDGTASLVPAALVSAAG